MWSQVKKSAQCQLRVKKHLYFSIVSLPTDSVIVVSMCHSHLYLQAVKLKLATPLSRLQVGLRARPLKAPYLVNSFFGR
jgi:hypothetical protein